MMRIVGAVVFAGLTVALGASPMSAQNRQPPDAPRPIDAAESLWAEELTSMEVRDALRAGTTTIIVATGGVEQRTVPTSPEASTTKTSRASFLTSSEQ